jgi:Zn-dependent protease
MGLLGASFRLGRLFDITIRVHVLFVLFAALWLWQGRDDLAGTAGFLALLFGVVLVHEFGHCFGARSVGGHAEDILMWPLGGLAYAHAPMTPWAQFVTVGSGPLVNLVFCVVSGAFVFLRTESLELILLNPLGGVMLPPGLSLLECVWVFYQINLMLLAFNLLPVYPLDGGQLFQCVLWPFMGLHQAMKTACQVGLVGCIGLGIWGLTREGWSMLIFIALFGGFTCWQRLQALKYGMIVDERIKYAPYRVYKPRGGGWWSRMFKRKPRSDVSQPEVNPNPGGWEARRQEDERLEAEVDRILKKVHEQGVQSLSYVERQKLEQASRERQRRERELERQNRF